MATLDLTIPAEDPGTEKDNGMPLWELEQALQSARTAGAKDTTQLHVSVNRNGRVQKVVAEVRNGDSDRTRALPENAGAVARSSAE